MGEIINFSDSRSKDNEDKNKRASLVDGFRGALKPTGLSDEAINDMAQYATKVATIELINICIKSLLDAEQNEQ